MEQSNDYVQSAAARGHSETKSTGLDKRLLSPPSVHPGSTATNSKPGSYGKPEVKSDLLPSQTSSKKKDSQKSDITKTKTQDSTGTKSSTAGSKQSETQEHTEGKKKKQ